MLPVERHRGLVVQEPALDCADGREAPHAALSDGALVVLLREQPAAGVAALYDRYGRLVNSITYVKVPSGKLAVTRVNDKLSEAGLGDRVYSKLRAF